MSGSRGDDALSGGDALRGWAGFDETVLDPGEEPVHEAPPADAQVRRELLRQRLAHALLLTANDDLSDREVRVQNIMERIAALPSSEVSPRNEADGRVVAGPGFARRGLLLRFAAAAVLVVGVVLVVWPDGMASEEVYATLRDARNGTFEGLVDRRFTLTVDKLDADGAPMQSWTHEWFSDGAGSFYGRLRGGELGNQTIGSDGKVVWRRSEDDPEDRAAGPVEDSAEVLGERINECGLFRAGHLEVGTLVDAVLQAAPETEIRFEGMKRLSGHTGELHVFRAGPIPNFGKRKLDVDWMQVDVDRGARVVERLEARVRSDRHDGFFELTFREEGVSELAPEFYGRPW